MGNPMYGQNKADKAIGSVWVQANAASSTQPALIISGTNVAHAIAPFAAKVVGITYNLSVATTTAVSILTIDDGAGNVIDTVTVPVASINTGGVLIVDDSDTDAVVAAGESISITSDGGCDAGAAVLTVQFQRI
tara:strand:- start:1128 stop:1529 length:402 start_codon:yes stop_codon:yes gene_type:complete